MALPLYQCSAPTRFDGPSHNAGLWYDKFVNTWDGNWTAPTIHKLDWIKTVTGSVGSDLLLREHAARQRQLVESCGGKTLQLKTESRFVTGLGREHPVENGFAWHHTLGTPYLPGSSVKGMIRNWAEQWACCADDADTILGSQQSVGRVLLLDALPTTRPLLEADVMTPHYGEYYQSHGDNIAAPGDWLSPNPILFLAVAAGQSFQFAILPNNADDIPHLETVSTWLTEALQWLGAGAKTAVGYGRFMRDETSENTIRVADESRRQEEAARRVEEVARQADLAHLATLPPDVADVVRLAKTQSWATGPAAFMQGLPAFLDQNSAPSTAVVEWIRDHIIEPHWKAAWANPTGSAAKKLKDKQLALLHRLRKLAGISND